MICEYPGMRNVFPVINDASHKYSTVLPFSIHFQVRNYKVFPHKGSCFAWESSPDPKSRNNIGYSEESLLYAVISRTFFTRGRYNERKNKLGGKITA